MIVFFYTQYIWGTHISYEIRHEHFWVTYEDKKFIRRDVRQGTGVKGMYDVLKGQASDYISPYKEVK